MSLSILNIFLVCAALWPALITHEDRKHVVLNGRCPARRAVTDTGLIWVYFTLGIYLLFKLAHSPSFELFLAWFVLPYMYWGLVGRGLIFWWTFRTVLVEFRKDAVWIIQGWSRTKLTYPVGFFYHKHHHFYQNKKYIAHAVTVLADSTFGVKELCHLENPFEGEKAVRLLNNTEASMRRNKSAGSL